MTYTQIISRCRPTIIIQFKRYVFGVVGVTELHQYPLFDFGGETDTHVHEVCGWQSLSVVKRVLDHVVLLQVNSNLYKEQHTSISM